MRDGQLRDAGFHRMSSDARTYSQQSYRRRRRCYLGMRIQLVEDAFQVVQLLAGFGKFAFRCQALVIGEVLAGLRDERVCILTGLAAPVASGAARGASAELSVEVSEPNRDASAASKVGA